MATQTVATATSSRQCRCCLGLALWQLLAGSRTAVARQDRAEAGPPTCTGAYTHCGSGHMLRRFRSGSDSSNASTNGNHAHARGSRAPSSVPDSQVSRRELQQLKWLTALVPGTVVLIYEFARQEALEHVLPALPVQYGNLIVWILVLVLTYAFAAFVFRVVERLQAQALARSRDLATLNAVVEERARLSRELHDGFAQLVAYMLVRLDTVHGRVE